MRSRGEIMHDMRVKGMSYRQIGKSFGVSHERARQLINQHERRYARYKYYQEQYAQLKKAEEIYETEELRFLVKYIDEIKELTKC